MAKYRIMKTTRAKHPVWSHRETGDDREIFYIQRKFLWFWILEDWYYSLKGCLLRMKTLRARDDVLAVDKELRNISDELVEEFE